MRKGCKKYIGRITVRGAIGSPYYIDADSVDRLKQIAGDDRLEIVEAKEIDPHENGRLKRTSGGQMESNILRNIYNDNKD